MQHHHSEIPYEEYDFDWKGDHCEYLIPVAVVDDQEEANESERTRHLCKEDVVEEKIKVEDLPFVSAEVVGAEEREEDGGHGHSYGHVTLCQLVLREDKQDVLKRNAERNEQVDEVKQNILFLPRSFLLIVL